ncbi:hypothetical protein A4A49_17454 [Nicotiana attenuata]|uniref:Uncharacterized protein n=1 Tax=Nicotiana attenuata TaxID=49451 RepID=A0A314LA65_NICAT|nr:hypothetical protein A4A49_17454 [Nicotiana attenuata]
MLILKVGERCHLKFLMQLGTFFTAFIEQTQKIVGIPVSEMFSQCDCLTQDGDRISPPKMQTQVIWVIEAVPVVHNLSLRAPNLDGSGGQHVVVPIDGNGSGGQQVGVPANGNGSGGHQQDLDGSGGQQVVVPADENVTPTQKDLDGSGGQQVGVVANGNLPPSQQVLDSSDGQQVAKQVVVPADENLNLSQQGSLPLTVVPDTFHYCITPSESSSVQRDDMLYNLVVSEISLSSSPNGCSGSVGIGPSESSGSGGAAPPAPPRKRKILISWVNNVGLPTDGNGSGGQQVGMPVDGNGSGGGQQVVVLTYGNGSGGQQVGVPADGNGSGGGQQVAVPADGNLPPSQQDLDGSSGQQVVEQVVVPVDGNLTPSQQVLDGSRGHQVVEEVDVPTDGNLTLSQQGSLHLTVVPDTFHYSIGPRGSSNSIKLDDIFSNLVVPETSMSSSPNGSFGSVGVAPFGSSGSGGAAPPALPGKSKLDGSGGQKVVVPTYGNGPGGQQVSEQVTVPVDGNLTLSQQDLDGSGGHHVVEHFVMPTYANLTPRQQGSLPLTVVPDTFCYSIGLIGGLNSVHRDDILSNLVVPETSLFSSPNGSSSSVGAGPSGSSSSGGAAPPAPPEKQKKPHKSGKPCTMGKGSGGNGGLFRCGHKY